MHPTRSAPSSLHCIDHSLQFVGEPTKRCFPTAASMSPATVLLFGVWFVCCVVKGNPSDGPEHLTPSPVGSRKERLLPSSHKACHKQLVSPPCQGTKSIAIKRLQSTTMFPLALVPIGQARKRPSPAAQGFGEGLISWI